MSSSPFSLVVFLGLTLSASASCFAASVQTLDTPSFKVKIEVQCDEGEVSCNKVLYTGTSKKSGQAITLKGMSLHTKCADGKTPCRFLGYQFKSGNILYQVFDEGILLVKNGDKVLVQENGTWQD